MRKRREPASEAVSDQRRHCVERCLALGVRDVHEADLPTREREVLTSEVALPLVVVAGEAVVGGVHADRDVELGHPLPEGVELSSADPNGSRGSRNRCRPDEDELGSVICDPLELLDRLSTMGSVMTGDAKMRPS